MNILLCLRYQHLNHSPSTCPFQMTLKCANLTLWPCPMSCSSCEFTIHPSSEVIRNGIFSGEGKWWIYPRKPLHISVADKCHDWKHTNNFTLSQKKSEVFKEDKMLATFNGLYIEKYCGWHLENLMMVVVTHPLWWPVGSADAILEVTYICHTQHIGQVFVMALQIHVLR